MSNTYKVSNDTGKPVTKTMDGKIVWRCPYHVKWSGMHERANHTNDCYSEISVCDDWVSLRKFIEWVDSVAVDWQGMHLDKDIVNSSNRVYCPEFCVFVPGKINTFFVDPAKVKVGVKGYKDPVGKFVVRVSNQVTGKHEYHGKYETAEDAFDVWVKRKSEIGKMLAIKYSFLDSRVLYRLNNYAT